MLDLTDLKWKVCNDGKTLGVFPKGMRDENGKLYWYKTSAYNKDFGFYGIEAISEVLASRLFDVLDIRHIQYDYFKAQILIDGKGYETSVCRSLDFKEGRETASMEAYLSNIKTGTAIGKMRGLDFDVDSIIIADYIIANTDRHLANLEVFVDKGEMCALFDNGCSLVFNHSDKELQAGYKYSDDSIINSFAGTTMHNTLDSIEGTVCLKQLESEDKDYIFSGFEGAISEFRAEYLWDFVLGRLGHVRNLGLVSWR
jgi:hypothetical protein